MDIMSRIWDSIQTMIGVIVLSVAGAIVKLFKTTRDHTEQINANTVRIDRTEQSLQRGEIHFKEIMNMLQTNALAIARIEEQVKMNGRSRV